MRNAVDWMLTRHAPYPAIAIDRHWVLLVMNGPAEALFGAVDLRTGDSLIDALMDNAAFRAALDNLEEVEWLSFLRLRTELAHFGADTRLEKAVERLAERVKRHRLAFSDEAPVVIPARYRAGDRLLSFISTIAQFGATGDIAMSEMRIELFFPADEDTKQAMQAIWPASSVIN
ncbi:MAG: hypothetical protein R3D84_13800 [Paracoccaceae bacterium]